MSCSKDAGVPVPRYDKTRLPQDLAVYAVTDSAWLDGRALEDVVAQAVEGGATFVQLREKGCTHEERCGLARRILPVCREHGVPFVVDDDVACALVVGADGVHVGQSDTACAAARAMLGPDAVVGVSAQTPEQARAAAEAGADYLGVGAACGKKRSGLSGSGGGLPHEHQGRRRVHGRRRPGPGLRRHRPARRGHRGHHGR